VDAAGRLWVNGSGVTQPISAASLPLPTGAATETSAAAAATSLAILDDWDESGRAKVNLIAGQAGITAGAGAVAANTPRTTLASDDPLVVSTGASGDAAATAGSTGTVQAKLRLVTSQLDAIKAAVETLDNAISGAGINITQVAGTNLSTGVGAAGAGTPRVAIARDSDVCNPIDTAQVAVNVSASGNTELVALTTNQTIYVCDVLLVAGGTVEAQLIYGTGTACATGETDMTGAVALVANTGYAHDFKGRLKTAASNALCLELSGAVSVQGVVTYRKAQL
jgi:hypothetical protein